MRILLFGGTTEGRVLASELVRRGHAVTVSVATEMGAEELGGSGAAHVVVGRLDADGMAELLSSFDLCIDATHPYAQEAHANVREACERADVPLRRVMRSACDCSECTVVASACEAAQLLAEREGPVLVTTGAKELTAFSGLDPARLYVRILPTHEGLAACERLGIPHRNVIALQGPFTTELNEALMRQYGIRWIVTKDGGRAGGIDEKLAAAKRCNVETILIARPSEEGLSVEELLESLGSFLSRDAIAPASSRPSRPSQSLETKKQTRVTLLGMGCAGEDLCASATAAIEQAELIVGAERLVRALPTTDARVVVEARTREVARILRESGASRAVVALSGDVGFFSGATRLAGLLEADGYAVEAIPGISSVQLLAARLGRPWQDWTLASAHGRDCDVMGALRMGRPLFLLTSGSQTVRSVCKELAHAGLGSCRVTVAERLGYTDEHVREGIADQMCEGDFDELNVMLVELPGELATPRRVPGIPDEAFVRGSVPMTKQEVRACILAKLAITPDDLCWDVGAGTGAVSVELALSAREVWAVERDAEALELVRKNRRRSRAWNLHVIDGTAPEVLDALPRPDAVFVGGSNGRLEDILDAAYTANPNVRLCVSAILLQTLALAMGWMETRGLNCEVTQVAVSRTRKLGDHSLLMAQNPVFLVTGTCR